ncbi:MAG TPA: polysialyltransferase family glycosyltransferase [Mariniflexile sp.]
MKSLLITSGSSQLIYQLSVLKNRVPNSNDVYVLYVGLFSESLDVFFSQMSKEFNFKYIGQIHFDIYPIKVSKKEFFYYLFYRGFPRLIKLVDNKFSLLKKFKSFDLIIMPVRVKMPADALLLSYLNPKQIIYVADGVIDILPNRNFKGWQYIYLKYLKSFPIPNKIYAPSFLETDIKRIGKFKEVKIQQVLESLVKIQLAKQFESKYLKAIITHVVLSQHYHLHENIELKSDVSYYEQIINYALQNKNAKVLFKPHPRDLKEKIEIIKKLYRSNNNILIVDDEYKSLPIELFYKYFIINKTVFLTGNSSAPLFYKNTNKVFTICSHKNLTKELNNRIKDFAYNYNLENINL